MGKTSLIESLRAGYFTGLFRRSKRNSVKTNSKLPKGIDFICLPNILFVGCLDVARTALHKMFGHLYSTPLITMSTLDPKLHVSCLVGFLHLDVHCSFSESGSSSKPTNTASRAVTSSVKNHPLQRASPTKTSQRKKEYSISSGKDDDATLGKWQRDMRLRMKTVNPEHAIGGSV